MGGIQASGRRSDRGMDACHGLLGCPPGVGCLSGDGNCQAGEFRWLDNQDKVPRFRGCRADERALRQVQQEGRMATSMCSQALLRWSRHSHFACHSGKMVAPGKLRAGLLDSSFSTPGQEVARGQRSNWIRASSRKGGGNLAPSGQGTWRSGSRISLYPRAASGRTTPSAADRRRETSSWNTRSRGVEGEAPISARDLATRNWVTKNAALNSPSHFWTWLAARRRAIQTCGGSSKDDGRDCSSSPHRSRSQPAAGSGHKRRYYELLSRPCTRSYQSGHVQYEDEETRTWWQEEEKEKGCRRQDCRSPAKLWQEEEEEEEETEGQSRRRRRRPLQQLVKHESEGRRISAEEKEEGSTARWYYDVLLGEHRQQHIQRWDSLGERHGSAPPEEESEKARKRIGNVGDPRQEPAQPSQPSRPRSLGPHSHPGGKNINLLRSPCAASSLGGNQGDEGAIHIGSLYGHHESRRLRDRSRPIGGSVHCTAPIAIGRQLGSCETHGADPLGGGQRSSPLTCPSNPQASAPLSKDARRRFHVRWNLWLRARQRTPAVVVLGLRTGPGGRRNRKRQRQEYKRKRQEWRWKRKRKDQFECPAESLGNESRESRRQGGSEVKPLEKNSGPQPSEQSLETEPEIGTSLSPEEMHEVSRAATLTKIVELAPGEFSKEGIDVSLHDVFSCIRNFDNLGIGVAWYLVQASAHPEAVDASALIDPFISAIKPGRYALPLFLGDLQSLVLKLKAVTLFEAMQQEFSDLYSGDAWVLLVMYGVNCLHSGPQLPPEGRWNVQHRRAVECIRQHVARFRKSATSAVSEVEGDLKKCRINYSGEELLQCHQLTLRQIQPALPPVEHGGCVQAVDWVGNITRHFLLNPLDAVIPDHGQPLPKLQGKIHIPPDEVDPIVTELVRRNICTWIPMTEVLRYRGQPVLNGMFGVEKPTRLEDNSPILRVIMNLVPSNSVLRQLSGGTSSLPYIGQWLSTVLEDNQELRIWQPDMSSAFYLFGVPRPWWGCLAFNIIRKGTEIDQEPNRVYALCCKVIPMGFNSSVSIMQEISERLLEAGGLPTSARISRGVQLPQWLTGVLRLSKDENRSCFHVYLDNFCAAARLEPPDTGEQAASLHRAAETAWRAAGVVSSEKKRKSAEPKGEELGCHIDGTQRTLGISADRGLKLAMVTLYLAGRKPLNRKMLQIACGRWVHAFQYRRPLMSCLDVIWAYIGRSTTRKSIAGEVRRELMRSLALLPMAHTYLGAEVANFVTASDASTKGGAIGIAKTLTNEGKDFIMGSRQLSSFGREIPVLVLSLCNGVGGSFRTYDVLGLRPMAMIAVDISKEANRITSRRWPNAEILEDVRSIDREVITKWALKYLQIEEIHLWAGFPCRDLCSAKAGRKNLDGEQSGLFFEIPRIRDLLREAFPPCVQIKFTLENVASMDRSAAEDITSIIGRTPYFLDPADAVPMHRPRLCWSSEFWDNLIPGVFLEEEQYWVRVHAKAEWPQVSAGLALARRWCWDDSSHSNEKCSKDWTAPSSCRFGQNSRWGATEVDGR